MAGEKIPAKLLFIYNLYLLLTWPCHLGDCPRQSTMKTIEEQTGSKRAELETVNEFQFWGRWGEKEQLISESLFKQCWNLMGLISYMTSGFQLGTVTYVGYTGNFYALIKHILTKVYSLFLSPPKYHQFRKLLFFKSYLLSMEKIKTHLPHTSFVSLPFFQLVKKKLYSQL